MGIPRARLSGKRPAFTMLSVRTLKSTMEILLVADVRSGDAGSRRQPWIGVAQVVSRHDLSLRRSGPRGRSVGVADQRALQDASAGIVDILQHRLRFGRWAGRVEFGGI